MKRPQKYITRGFSFIQMIHDALSYYPDVSTHNRTNSPCPYKQTNWGQDASPRLFRAVAHSARPGAVFWLTAVSQYGGGHGRTRDHSNQAALAELSHPVGQLCGHRQSHGTAGFRGRKISLDFTFTTSCCLSSVNARGTRQYSPM